VANEETESSKLADARAAFWRPWRAYAPNPPSHPVIIVSLIASGVIAVLGVWLRFSAPSPLWLDEALTVNIAHAPLGRIPSLLKRDGAPPLYYAALHGWMAIFGTSDLAVRSLAGVASVLTVVALFFLVRRVFGGEVALITSVLLLAAPFATYFATESRMYAVVMLEVVILGWGVVKLYERPGIWPSVVVALSSAALLYTHYWSIYLLAMVGGWWVVTLVWSGGRPTRRAAWWGLGSLFVAGLSFLPWLPTFLYQSKHTGTPWATPPGLQIAITGVLHFYDNPAANPAPPGPGLFALQVLTAGLVVTGVFGIARSRFVLELDLHSIRRGRFLAAVVFGTLAIGMIGAHLSKSTFVPRYAAVAFIPLIVLLALGTQALWSAWFRVVVVAIFCGVMLSTAIVWRSSDRTQAVPIVTVLKQQAKPGDLVLFCPDQLGPSVMRILPSDLGLRTFSYPRFDDPRFVNWVDYDQAIHATSPSKFASKVEHVVDGHSVWLVWSTGYGPFKSTCGYLASTLLTLPGWNGHQWVNAHQFRYFQSMNLTQFVPPSSQAHSRG